MHREIAADAVAGAVIEIEPGPPQKLPRQSVELRAGGAVRKHGAGDGDVALEHQSEIAAHLGARRADGNRARDVGGAVFILAAGIDEEQLARCDAAVAGAGDAVMHDGAVGTGAGDGGERERP